MYSKKTQGWVKHADFILLDILCLQAAFILAYITRHGLTNPFASDLYLNMAAVYAMIDLLVMIANRTMKNVLKRGYYLEFLHTIKHNFLVALIISAFLFSTKYADEYSRATFYLTALFYLIIAYVVRLVWKQILKKTKMGIAENAMFLVTTAERAGDVISKIRKHTTGNYRI